MPYSGMIGGSLAVAVGDGGDGVTVGTGGMPYKPMVGGKEGDAEGATVAAIFLGTGSP